MRVIHVKYLGSLCIKIKNFFSITRLLYNKKLIQNAYFTLRVHNYFFNQRVTLGQSEALLKFRAVLSTKQK